MKELKGYERPQMEVVDIDREDAVLTSGSRGNPGKLCPIDRSDCMGYNYSQWCYDR